MNNIGKYLERFTFLGQDKRSLRLLIIKTLKDFGYEISEKDFKIKEGTVYFTVSPILRTEIFFKKNKLLNEIHKDPVGKVVQEFK